jgi:hypothetical protein
MEREKNYMGKKEIKLDKIIKKYTIKTYILDLF